MHSEDEFKFYPIGLRTASPPSVPHDAWSGRNKNTGGIAYGKVKFVRTELTWKQVVALTGRVQHSVVFFSLASFPSRVRYALLRISLGRTFTGNRAEMNEIFLKTCVLEVLIWTAAIRYGKSKNAGQTWGYCCSKWFFFRMPCLGLPSCATITYAWH